MNAARSRSFVALIAGMALLGAACGSSDDSEEGSVIVVESAIESSGDTSSSDEASSDEASSDEANGDEADGESAAAGLSGNEEEQALAFAQCMRDDGIDFPDPIVNADGSVDFFGGGGGRDGDGGGFRNDPGFQDAIDDCGGLIEGASFLPNQDDFTDLEDTFLEAAECLRDNGIDVADPDFGDGAGGGGPFGADFDPDDPATAAALDACQDVFAGLGRGQGGN